MQTTRLDASAYRTAEQLLRHNRATLVRGDTVTPQWIDGGARFWYPADTPDGRQLVIVDPAARTVEPAPDPAALVAGAAGGNPLEIPSPDGRFVVFRRGYDLWARGEGREWPLTSDGDADHDYGASPDYFMYSIALTRLGLPHAPPAVVWSPDSTRVLTHRTNQEGVRRTYSVESMPADGGAPRLRDKRSAFPGDDRMQLAEFVVLDVTAGTVLRAEAEPVEMPAMSPIFLKLAWWAEDGSAVYYLRSPREGHALSLHRLDPDTGEVRTVLTETGDTRVEAGQQPLLGPVVRIIAGGDEVLWYSQRDGWGHLYRHGTRAGEPLGRVTSGQWAVQRILRVDEDRRMVYFLAAGLVAADPYRRSVCRVGLDGTGFAMVTDDDLDHVVTVSPNGEYFLDSASTTDTPPVTVVRDWAGRVLVEVARADVSALAATGWTPPERFRVLAADGETEVYGLLYRPHGFDPARRYPVIDHAYPIPMMTRVSPSFDPGWHGYDAEALAALGFAVIAVDGRGTPGRDRAFHDASYQRMADACGLADHVAALTQLAAAHPWLDTDQVGMLGISAGGFATVRAMADYPDVFTVGVAQSGLHDFRYGDPGSAQMYGPYDERVAALASNVDAAGKVVGKLLLVHGGLDDQVSPDLTLRLVERLVAEDKDFELLIVPGAEHVYLGYEHYVNRRTWDFLVRALLGVEPPAGYRLTPVG
ncbi:prolyl oligopeptidase family serine peptidase [Solihabitans fulvus]|uniref:Prolyl oligopeptidase family serine peptidase n=1 Tax=Solihabitans fulvus TaxID=1892852 RepID=A0A5B2WTW3_9PSEU|nr:DPP IV N-terminal domain-containing protein [Solihabitans fulvus]KAA2255443.1 prolyl oligopeptidase family serine peptidase [Solihabitans fulvus]